MGDHRLPGSQARRTLKPTSQDTSAKSMWKESSKCFSKHKREQLRLPTSTSVENKYRLRGKEQPGSDDFRKAVAMCKGLTLSSMEDTLFPTISNGVCSSFANKNQPKSPDDSELFYPLLTVQRPRKTIWDKIGSHHDQELFAPWPRGKESSADILIKMLETPRPNWIHETPRPKRMLQTTRPKRMLENKWPYREDHREATKQPTTSAKQSQRKIDLEHQKLPWSCEGTWVHDGKHRGQDMLSSLYYKYIYKGGKDEWAEKFRDSVQHIDTGYDNQSSCEEPPVRRINMCNCDTKYDKKVSKGKDTPLSKEESSFVIKLQTPPDLYTANKHKQYESPFLKNSQLKTPGAEETNPYELELQGENAGKSEQTYEPTDWKYFISKEDTTPSTLEQMFMKKRWGCERSSPTSKMFRDYYWIVDSDDDDDDDDEEEEEEETLK
ncbi:uncharacterized protein LOC116091580 [Mastomys coucha]|uniref:uncharacterized protein LOC116091580 n=1 Tax=Mastomys coucha TaxID=35658 RepID=UPI0012626720|nr:uncharacterized protein LOC116091580 [Mastomys coucha]